MTHEERRNAPEGAERRGGTGSSGKGREEGVCAVRAFFDDGVP